MKKTKKTEPPSLCPVKDCPVAGELLKRAVYDGGAEAYFDNNSIVAQQIKSSSQFQSLISETIKNNSNLTEFDTYAGSSFEREGLKDSALDLYLAFHYYKVAVSGTKNVDGTWSIRCTLGDAYNFEKHDLYEKDGYINPVVTAINNGAYSDQLAGVIKPFPTFVDMEFTSRP